MPGYPSRLTFDDLGGPRENVFPVTNPRTQLDAKHLTACLWQVAGLNRTGALVSITIDANGARLSGAEAWNPKDDPAKRVAIGNSSVGEYTFTAASKYPDETDTERDVIFTGAQVTVHATVPVVAVYTLQSATQIKVFTFDPLDSFNPVAAAFTIDIK